MGVRRSALRSNLENALRFSGSSIGRPTRCASARAARRTNELRVSPALRAAASIALRSVSDSDTRTLRMMRVYPLDIPEWNERPALVVRQFGRLVVVAEANATTQTQRARRVSSVTFGPLW